MKRNTIIALLWAMLCPTLPSQAQKTNQYDLRKPFGWAVCSSLEGGHYDLNGGEGGQSITLTSNGGDMGKTILKALQENDIVVLDGSKGPFVVSKTIRAEMLKGKTLCGRNGALLTTTFKMTPDIRAKLDSANVKALKTSGNGYTLSNGSRVKEEAEYHVRQLLIDYLNDPRETYRHSGILALNGCENIIVSNIRFEGPGSVDVSGDDLLTASRSTHLWVDHCEFVDGMDGNFDINSRSDFITVSWCTFSYSQRAYMHMNTNLVGANDREEQGVDNLNVTYACCIWGKGCDQRMPMARWGTIHVLNCLYDCAGNSAAANARMGCEMLVEGCFFGKGVAHPFRQKDAKAWNLKDNHYADPFSTEDEGVVNIPYRYAAFKAEEVPAVLTGEGGAGILPM